MNVSLTKKEIDTLKDIIGSKFYNFTDDYTEEELKDNETYQNLTNIDNKLTRGFNKTGRWYLWQLKDESKPVTDDNIKEEWKK